jgi:hypothetical protein
VSTVSPRYLERISAYLDGALSADDRAALDAELVVNAALREEFEAMSAVDASLSRLFEYGEEAAAAPAPIPLKRGVPRTVKWGALAAALLLAGAGAWYFTRPDPLLIPPQQVWANMEAVNFKPVWRCENDEQFIQLLRSRLGEAFLIQESEQLRVVGWAYGADYVQYPLSKDTLILINKVGDEHSIILIDRADKERNLKVPASTGLNLFKERVGGLVLYELTPLPEPRVLRAVKPV